MHLALRLLYARWRVPRVTRDHATVSLGGRGWFPNAPKSIESPSVRNLTDARESQPASGPGPGRASVVPPILGIIARIGCAFKIAARHRPRPPCPKVGAIRTAAACR